MRKRGERREGGGGGRSGSGRRRRGGGRGAAIASCQLRHRWQGCARAASGVLGCARKEGNERGKQAAAPVLSAGNQSKGFFIRRRDWVHLPLLSTQQKGWVGVESGWSQRMESAWRGRWGQCRARALLGERTPRYWTGIHTEQDLTGQMQRGKMKRVARPHYLSLFMQVCKCASVHASGRQCGWFGESPHNVVGSHAVEEGMSSRVICAHVWPVGIYVLRG